MIRCPDPVLAETLDHLEKGLVFVASSELESDWDSIRSELLEAFTLSRRAALAGEPIVYLLRNDDLLGRNGRGSAVVATGLLSAARTAALELSRSGVPVNVLAIEAETSAAAVSEWIEILLDRPGPQGELVRLGPGHLGKALP